jgi:F0F1-type ATP synthase membrane subunit b/b'
MRLLLLAIASSFLMFGCDRSEGPAEEMGEEVDEAVDDAQDTMDEAAEEVEEEVDDATDERAVPAENPARKSEPGASGKKSAAAVSRQRHERQAHIGGHRSGS